ncbi:MAG: hypothetical protein WB630_04230 [Candidatus Acidiferrales bacterium]
MSPAARTEFEEYFLRRTASPTLRRTLHADDFLYKPVDVRTFCEDPYYLGSILHDGLYPKLLDDLIELFDGSYMEVLLTGAIGYGKSTMAEVGMCYDPGLLT